MERQGDIDPHELLRLTEVHDGIEWRRLDSPTAVNDYVFDAAGAILPVLALKALIACINDFNFSFLLRWKATKVPRRFMGTEETVKSAHIDPLIGQLIGEEVATLQQLEEYYSLEDAYKMFDVLVARGVNKALANEAATKAAQTSR